MNEKEKRQYHKISFLTNLLLLELDELNPESELGAALHLKTKEYSEILEPLIEVMYGPKEIRNSTYLMDMSNKIDTIIRKNYEEITS
jgi:hypothetical protein